MLPAAYSVGSTRHRLLDTVGIYRNPAGTEQQLIYRGPAEAANAFLLSTQSSHATLQFAFVQACAAAGCCWLVLLLLLMLLLLLFFPLQHIRAVASSLKQA